MLYWKICLTGGQVLLEGMFCRKTYFCCSSCVFRFLLSACLANLSVDKTGVFLESLSVVSVRSVDIF